MRYTRHELKQDKFAESAMEAVHEVVEHRSDIIRIAIAVVAVLLFASGVYWYVQSHQDAANNALGQAMVTYSAPVLPPGTPAPQGMVSFHNDQERLIEAKEQFYAVSDKYGWTKSGQYAHYLAAMCEQELGNDKVAEDQLHTVASSRHHDIAALAQYALASAYRGEKRDQDAINVLQNLIDHPTSTVPKASAEMALADLYLSQHQPDKAKVLLDQIVKENPNNGLGEIAKARETGSK